MTRTFPRPVPRASTRRPKPFALSLALLAASLAAFSSGCARENEKERDRDNAELSARALMDAALGGAGGWSAESVAYDPSSDTVAFRKVKSESPFTGLVPPRFKTRGGFLFECDSLAFTGLAEAERMKGTLAPESWQGAKAFGIADGVAMDGVRLSYSAAPAERDSPVAARADLKADRIELDRPALGVAPPDTPPGPAGYLMNLGFGRASVTGAGLSVVLPVRPMPPKASGGNADDGDGAIGGETPAPGPGADSAPPSAGGGADSVAASVGSAADGQAINGGERGKRGPGGGCLPDGSYGRAKVAALSFVSWEAHETSFGGPAMASSSLADVIASRTSRIETLSGLRFSATVDGTLTGEASLNSLFLANLKAPWAWGSLEMQGIAVSSLDKAPLAFSAGALKVEGLDASRLAARLRKPQGGPEPEAEADADADAEAEAEPDGEGPAGRRGGIVGVSNWLALPFSLSSASLDAFELTGPGFRLGADSVSYEGPVEDGVLGDSVKTAKGFWLLYPGLEDRRDVWAGPDGWIRRLAGAALSLGTDGFRGTLRHSTDHDPETGRSVFALNEFTVDGLFGVKAKLELAGVTQPLADALASPSKFPGAEYRYLKRLADAPEFLNAGIRGWELDFADVSLMERLSRGPGQSEREPADMAAPFEALFEEPADMAAAFEAIFEEFAYLIESVLRLPVNPAFREASAAWSAAPGSFKIAFRPASTATASEIIETFGKGRRDPEGFRKLLQIVVSVEGGPEIPLLEKGSKLMQGPQRSRLSY